jgi:predicted phosphodiesterase
MDSISKKQFLMNVENSGIAQDKSYYSFDKGGLHCIVLDANFTSDGIPYDHGNFDWTDANIPEEEQDWLKNDLSNSNKPVIVFLHQLLDGEGSVYIKNATQVRKILEASNKVIAVFQGHHHAGQYNQIHKIHYVTLKAVIEGSGEENNAFAIANFEQDRIVIRGYRKAVSRNLEINS